MSIKSLGLSVAIGAALGGKYFSVFDSAEKRAFKLGKALRETNKKLDATKQVTKYKALLEKLQEKQRLAGGGSKRLARGIAEVEGKYKAAKRAAKSYGISIGSVVNEQRRLNKEAQRTEKTLARLSKVEQSKRRLGAIRGGAIGALGLAFGAGSAVGSAFGVERRLIRLKTVVNAEDSATAIKKSVAHAVAFAQRSLATQENVLDIEYSLNSAGLSASASRAGSEIVSKLATVTDGVSEEVGVIVGDSFQNFQAQLSGGIEDKMNRIGNVLLKTQERFSIKNFNQLGESIKEATSAAIGANIPFEQMAAAVGQLNSAGLKGTKAGTAFKALVGQLVQKQEKLGISIAKTADGGTDLLATMRELKTRLIDVGGPTEQLAFLQKNLGLQGSEAAILLLNNMGALAKGYDFVSSKNDKLSEDYKTFVDSASGQWQMLTQNIGLVGTVIAGTLLPAINSILQPIGKLAIFVSEMAQKYPLIGQAIGIVSGALVGYAAVLVTVTAGQWAFNTAALATTNGLVGSAAAWVASKTAMVAASVATKAITAAQWLLNAALTANPIGLVIAGVTAFAALAVVVYKKWEPIKAFFLDLWNSVGGIVGKVTSFFGARPDNSTRRTRGRIKAAAVGAALAAPTAALPAGAAAAAAAPTQVINNQQYHITQQPGEDMEAFARRVDELQQERALREEADVG